MVLNVVDSRKGKTFVKLSLSHEEWKALDPRLKDGLSKSGIIAEVGKGISCMLDGSAFGLGEK